MQAKQRNARDSFTTSHGQPSAGKPGSVTLRKAKATPPLQTSFPSSFFPQNYMLSMMSYGLECPSGQLGSAYGITDVVMDDGKEGTSSLQMGEQAKNRFPLSSQKCFLPHKFLSEQTGLTHMISMHPHSDAWVNLRSPEHPLPHLW